MNKLILPFLILSVVCYFLGIVFAQKTKSAILRLFSLLKKSIISFKEFCKLQGDRIFLFFIIVVPVSTFYFLYKSLELDKLIQFLIVEGTFFAVIYSVLIKDNASKYRKRPIIGFRFSDNKSHYYHQTILYDTTPTWSNKNINGSLPTYFISAEVINKGKTMLENVEVVLQKVESEKPLTRPFLPLNLNWSFKGETLGIPPYGMSRLINIIEVREPNEAKKILTELITNGSGPDENRYLELSKGFRSCTVKPNTLSDIFPTGKYTFYLVVTASNAEPKSIKMEIEYNGKWDKSTSINDMRSTHLKVKLIEQKE